MKRDPIRGSALESRKITQLGDGELSAVSGGLTVATETTPKPSAGQSVYDYAERLGRYLSAQAGGGYSA